MSNREFTATRTMLANAFATAGAELLGYMNTAAALAAIPNTDPPRYVVAGTLAMIAKVLPSADAPAAATVLTDEVRAAMKRAYSLGQTYWQQADSEYTSQHKKADVTAGRFIELTDEICSKVAVLAKEAAIEAPNDPKQLEKWWSLRGSVITAAINQEPARFPVEDLSELLNVFDAALPDESNGSSDLAHAGVTAEPVSHTQFEIDKAWDKAIEAEGNSARLRSENARLIAALKDIVENPTRCVTIADAAIVASADSAE